MLQSKARLAISCFFCKQYVLGVIKRASEKFGCFWKISNTGLKDMMKKFAQVVRKIYREGVRSLCIFMKGVWKNSLLRGIVTETHAFGTRLSLPLSYGDSTWTRNLWKKWSFINLSEDTIGSHCNCRIIVLNVSTNSANRTLWHFRIIKYPMKVINFYENLRNRMYLG